MRRAPLLLVILSGCSGSSAGLPPSVADVTAITSTWQQLNSVPITPSAYSNIGMTLDDEACYAWFDQQVLASQRRALGQSALGLGSGGAALAGGPGGLAAAGALGMTSAFLGAIQADSPAGPDPVAALALVVRMRQAYDTAMQAAPSLDVAFRLLNAYHQLCSLGGIRLAMAMAVMNAPIAVVPAPAPAPRPPVVPPPPPPSPPVVAPPANPTNPTVTPSLRESLVAPPTTWPSFAATVPRVVPPIVEVR